MSTSSMVDRLRHNLLFENVTEKQFNAVKGKLRERHYHTGDVIVEDDTEGEELFMLVEGRVKILKKTKHGEEKLLALLHPGDFFGELELVDSRPRSAQVVALDECITYTLHKSDFEKLLHESHAFAIRLMQVLSLRLRSSNTHFIVELQRNAQRAATELRRLEQLIEASKVLNSTLDLDKLLDIILETALGIVNGERGTVYLIDEEKQELWSRVFKGTEIIKIQLPIGKGIAGYVAATGDTLNIPDAYMDPRFNPEVDKQTGYRTKTILCMPMNNKDGKIIGVFQLLNKRQGLFTRDDENFIAALSVHAAIAIENARLYEEEKAFMRMQEEVRLAAKIQHDLLPKTFPEIPGYDIAGRSIPAQLVGGDYFDFIPMEDHRLAVCLGDVSGKGLPASLLMANLQATLRGQTLVGTSAKERIIRSNKLLHESTSAEKFVTLFYGILDSTRHELVFCNAGHDNPFILTGKGVKKNLLRLKTGGIVLSIMEYFPYEEEIVALRLGDLLIIYSDGIAEAMNEHHEQFGEDRIATIIKKYHHNSANEILEKIILEAKKHAGSWPQSDDMTIVVVKRTG
jgi:sigma-B regulation protein RsbU (phosphoserine phosphatase)